MLKRTYTPIIMESFHLVSSETVILEFTINQGFAHVNGAHEIQTAASALVSMRHSHLIRELVHCSFLSTGLHTAELDKFLFLGERR